MANVFISYTENDEPHARGLGRMLVSAGHNVFSYLHTPAPPGTDFRPIINQHLQNADFVVLLWSSDSVGSPWVNYEIEEACRRQRIIIPVLLEHRVPLPASIAMIQGVRAIDKSPGWIVDVAETIITRIQMAMHQNEVARQNEGSWLGTAAKVGLGILAVGAVAAWLSDDDESNSA